MNQQNVSVGFLDDALRCFRRQGFQAQTALEAAGLSKLTGDYVTTQQYGLTWLAIANATDDEFFGLGARPMRRGSFSLMCHAVLHAGTLGRALRRALGFLRAVLDYPRGELAVVDGHAEIVLLGRTPVYEAFAYRAFWLLLLGLACWLTGRRIPLRVIEFACSCPKRRPDYLDFFGVPVHFDKPQTRLIFDAALLELPTIRSERALKAFLREAPANLLVRYRHDPGIVTRMREELKTVPTGDWPSFDAVATKLGLSPATLRRRLQVEGQSYAAIKEEVRSTLAQSLLRESKLSVAEIAVQLGFSEPSAFHRAFRKWTGTSPGKYRAQIQRRVGDPLVVHSVR
ncbi:AraC family transcriptional regulator [Paraburkholderia diazotrophica]|uniref:AraC family transcriptional regulator n=1 Tax=Paraburkholderia diazotrophica TaxID=667676 RepID=UPI0031737E27